MVKIVEAARRCGVSRQTIYYYIEKGYVAIDEDAAKFGVYCVNLDDCLKISRGNQSRREKRLASIKASNTEAEAI